MIRITLNDHDRQQLEHTFTTTADRRLRDRCQAILMADRGGGAIIRSLKTCVSLHEPYNAGSMPTWTRA